MSNLLLHEPYKELKLAYKISSLAQSLNARLHEPYKELKHEVHQRPLVVLVSRLHEPYKELKQTGAAALLPDEMSLHYMNPIRN